MPSHDNSSLIRKGAGITAVVVGSVVLAGCYAPRPAMVRTTTVVEDPVRGTTAYVTIAPPASRTEIVPAAPGPQYVWDPGRWAWNGASYEWVAGQYVARPRAEAVWVAGHWANGPNGWIWEEGRWG
jgi:hypothetical protein